MKWKIWYLFVICILWTYVEAQRSLFDGHKNSGASVRRSKIERINRSYNEQRKQKKVASNNLKGDDERTVSLFENRVDGSPDEIGYGQFYTSASPNQTILHGQRKDSSNTQIIINLTNQPGSFLYEQSGYGKHKHKHPSSPTPPTEFPSPPTPPESPSPPAPPADQVLSDYRAPLSEPLQSNYLAPQAPKPQGPPYYPNQLLDSYGQLITTTVTPPSDSLFIEPPAPPAPAQLIAPPGPPIVRPPAPPPVQPPGPPEENRYNSWYTGSSYGVPLAPPALQAPVASYAQPARDSDPVLGTYSPPDQDELSSYGAPQAPPQSALNFQPQNSLSNYGAPPPPQNPSSGYGPPPPPPPPPQNPAPSYAAPLQTPSSSYGAPQAPPLSAAPQQNNVPSYAPPQDPVPSYNPPADTPQPQPAPIVVQQVVPQGLTLSLYPIQSQQQAVQQPQADFSRPSYDQPQSPPQRAPQQADFTSQREDHVHYHVHVDDVRNLQSLDQIFTSNSNANNQPNDDLGSSYGAPAVVSADQSRQRDDQLRAPTAGPRSSFRGRLVRLRPVRRRPSYRPSYGPPPSTPPPSDAPLVEQNHRLRDHLLFKCVIWCGLSHTQFYEPQNNSNIRKK